MSWASPSVLWLLLVVLALPLWWMLQRRLLLLRRRSLGALQGQRYRGRSRLRQVCINLAMVLAWVALVVALAGPRQGGEIQYEDAEGYSILLVLDCSYSMHTRDLYPSRMHHAHFKVHDLLRLMPNAEVGLLPFAGIAALRSPLTTDHTGVRLLLQDCTPNLFRREDQGTAIGNAIQRAVVALQSDEERGRVIVVLSDGDDPNQQAVREAAERAQKEGITIYGLVVGDPEQNATLVVDGREQPMPPTRQTLDYLSQATGGLTLFTTSDDSDMRTIVAHMFDHVQAHSWRLEEQVVTSERYQWPLAVALLFLSLALLLPMARRPTATLLVVLVVGPWLGLGQGLAADEFAAQVAEAVERSDEDVEQARAQLDAVLLQRPDHQAAHYNRGLLSEGRQRQRYHLRRAASGANAQLAAAAHHHLATISVQEGRYRTAGEHLQESLRLQPDDERYAAAWQRFQAHFPHYVDDTNGSGHEHPLLDPQAGPLRQLPPARVHRAYSQELLADLPGAERVRLWGSGELPPGLQLSATGRLSGQPQAAGSYRFRVVISDGEGSPLAQPWLGLSVLPQLSLDDEHLPPAVVGEFFQHRFRVQGAVRPQWSLQGLPQGVQAHVQNDGSLLVQGVPRRADILTLRLRVTDADGARLERELAWEIASDPVPDRQILPAATRSAAYQHQLQMRGADATPWRPDQAGGLHLGADGRVQGVAEDEPVITLVSELAGREWQLRVPVNARPALLLPESLRGIVGRPERWRLPVRDGTPPFTWSIEEGELPEGLTLREDGVLLGAPQEEGDFPLTIVVLDRWQALARTQMLVHIRERAAAHEEEPPPQGDETSDPQEGEAADDCDEGGGDEPGGDEPSDDPSDTGASDQGQPQPQPDQDADDSSPDDGAEQSSEQQQETGEQDPAPGEQEPDDGPGPDEDDDEGPADHDQEDAPAEPAEVSEAAPDRAQQEARRWLDDILREHQGDLDESLRDFMRHSGEGSGDRSQPW